MHEERLIASAFPSDPFAVDCSVRVQGPNASRHSSMKIGMFYDGGMVWAWRLTPDQPGEWIWNTECESLGLINVTGTIEASASSEDLDGSVIVDAERPTHLVYESGQPYTMVGLEADWLWAFGLVNGVDALDSVVDALDAIGINHVLVQIFANYTNNSPLPELQAPRVSPTFLFPSGGTPWVSKGGGEYHYKTLDLDFWRNYDALLASFAKRGMVAHVMFFVGNKNVRWPDAESDADDVYWRYAMARLGAFPSILLDVSKEAGSANAHRNTDYFVNRMKFMRDMNAHKRILTAHSGFDWDNSCGAAPELCDVMSAQVHPTGTGPISAIAPLYYSLLKDSVASSTVPYLDIEFMYQYGPVDHCHFACCGSCTNSTSWSEDDGFDSMTPEESLNEMRRVMWDHYLAGTAGAAWYHNDMGWDIFDPEALSTTASVMRSLRTLRDFWDAVSLRNFYPKESCVTALSPPDAVVHCTAKTSGDTTIAVVIHVRTANATFVLIPVNNSTNSSSSGFWLDPASFDSTQVPFEGGPATVLRQPTTFLEDAVLFLEFV